ncbi:TPA: winged helix-turn-helix transcriptional regulator [Bacillus toyonensis]|uniref:winged helix-turn-helix transcriptional regulator n=1 Tax=Bacillus cereus group TaxID=86661 RepID=UPI000B44A3EF|nr:winged helix-turn-helix transcriptional regulator [Bacillus toyonensis]OTX10855.1 MarR family transcriptional regulator [Bacillus thuringiensis serovar seoulensis]MCA1048089.1 winged helix-turn-helix transcriptional regulator [Bacillus toyonensis]MDO8160153.1 winged helix-turn-helix transcriptional regulator [Bacillus toyonensis]MED3201006.1 winged helix-turn-helix transcriptional regulator [Bacillus toyonensis]HDR7951137.1 winged helix-turn-helix transcriptional regulator [Bacillus toyonen
MKEYNFPIEATLDVVGGKWKVVLLCILLNGKKRSSEIKRAMPNITQKMLTQQLRELESDGIINRTVHSQVPPKVEYSLSEYGQTLTAVLDCMCEWGQNHIQKQLEDSNVK